MARLEEIERRLLNWARCKHSGGSGDMGYAAVSLGEAVGQRAAYRTTRMPTMECEADETDQAINALPNELRYTVHVVYLDTRGEAMHLVSLACSRTTLKARIARAHQLLNDWFLERERQRLAERRRVQALQDQAGTLYRGPAMSFLPTIKPAGETE